jgi:peptide/nickel transport system permease protein
MTIDYLVLRSLQSLVLIFLATLVVFCCCIRLAIPRRLSWDQATPQQVADLRRSMGLDRPLYEQYGRFLANAVHGDFGLSIRAQRPALMYVLERLPATLQLSAGAFAFAVLTGIPIGILSAVKRLSLWDHGAMFVALLVAWTRAAWSA